MSGPHSGMSDVVASAPSSRARMSPASEANLGADGVGDARADGAGDARSDAASGASGITMRHLLDGLRGTDICVFFQDADLVYRWIENPPKGFDESLIGRSDHDIPVLAEATGILDLKAQVLREGAKRRGLAELRENGRKRVFDMVLDPQRDAHGTITGLLGIAIEVTERINREERLRVLLREVSHRSRNLLAIVQSIASQTVRTASAPSRFLERFNERLQSLAHTLDLVTVSEWEGATVHRLVSRQAGPFVTATGAIEISGPDPVLTPNAALHLGLAVQELSSNATSHGIWSRAEGKVTVRTRLENDALIFEWSEAGLDTEAPDMSDGSFGARTLSAIVPAAVGGRATVDREGAHFVYRLVVPAGNFDL